MAETTVGTIRRLLETTLEECESETAHFQIRTAMQLLALIEERERLVAAELADADLPPDLAGRLVDLGYLD